MTSNHLLDCFQDLGWPLPESQDIYYGVGGKKLVFMTDFGIVARYTPVEEDIGFSNPHFLKSLFRRKVGDGYLDLDPGVQCPVTWKESDQIFVMIWHRYRIEMRDEKANNAGFIPGTDYPVLIDLDPVNVKKITVIGTDAGFLTRSAKAIRKRLGLMPSDDQESNAETPQDTQYRDLRNLMQRAWPAHSAKPDIQAVADFMHACAAYRKENKLLSCWEYPENKYRDNNMNAANYRDKLHAAGIGTPQSMMG